MAKRSTYDVATNVMLEQGRASLAALRAPANQRAAADLKAQGLDVASYVPDLDAAVVTLSAAEVQQERLKTGYVAAAKDDSVVAERGYRWVLKAQAKGRAYATSVDDDPHDVMARLRVGKLRAPRARGVAYELRILLPELAELVPVLSPYGVNQALLDEGQGIMQGLGVEQSGSRASLEEQKQATAQVHAGELTLSKLLARLEAADQAAALEREDASPHFALDILKTERARLKAARQARLIARQPGSSVAPEE